MYPELLERVKTILQLEWVVDDDNILNEIIGNFVQMINLYVNTETLPVELEFVVVEGAVARYLRVGSEGYESESFGEINISYQEILEPYFRYLDAYKSTNINKVRFL